MDFAQMMENEIRNVYTENGALTYDHTNSALLDLFSLAGSMRDREEEEIIDLFDAAYLENPLYAVKMVFYFRDIRAGQGERRCGRILLSHMAEYYTEIMVKNLDLIEEYGRFDDLYYLVGTKAEDAMWSYVREKLAMDVKNMEEGKPVSLLAKWLKKADSKNEKTKRFGIYTAKKLGLSIYDYKRICVRLRRYLGVTEQCMSERKWEEIDYKKVSSGCMLKNSKSFLNHDTDGFKSYLDKVLAGKAKIHAKTLYPYELVRELRKVRTKEEEDSLTAQWNALPDYVGEGENILVMADVSGSMTVNAWRPLDTSVGLAMYFAERNKGPFHNMFMTFSENPAFVKVKGDRLSEKLDSIRKADWGMNTDLKKALDKILKLSVDHHVANEDMPRALLIISDMEFDACQNYGKNYYYLDYMKKEYENAGYTMPVVIFWNVNARNNTYHACYNRKGVQLASGQSVNVFKSLLNGENLSAYQYMLSVLNDERYDKITI